MSCSFHTLWPRPPSLTTRNGECSMLSNPLHALIEQLDKLISAAWACHHAGTKDESDRLLKTWHAARGPFWPAHRTPRQALRRLADPALVWCSQRGFTAPEHVRAVEAAAQFVTRLATWTAPCAMPSVYADEEDASKPWEDQGECLLAGLRAQEDLQRLVALTGNAWLSDSRLMRESTPHEEHEEAMEYVAHLHLNCEVPPPSGVPSALLQQLHELRFAVSALDRYAFEPGRLAKQPGYGDHRSYSGPVEFSPAPHNR
jgi:hypothetical protein